jgi:hypothetical protein
MAITCDATLVRSKDKGTFLLLPKYSATKKAKQAEKLWLGHAAEELIELFAAERRKEKH